MGKQRGGQTDEKRNRQFPQPGGNTRKFKYIRYDDATPVIEQLFDLEKDPGEENDLADKSECRDVLEKPGSRLDQFNTENEQHRNKYTPAAILDN